MLGWRLNNVSAMAVASVALCSVSFGGLADAGEYYKWKGADGAMHYSQTQPVGQSATRIYVDDAAPSPPLLGAGVPSRTGAPRADQNTLHGTDVQAAKDNCIAARKNIAGLESGKKLLRGDSTDMRTLTPAEREQALRQARAQTARFCLKP